MTSLLRAATTWVALKNIMLSKKKVNLKRFHAYDSIYVTFLKEWNYRDGE